MFLASSLEHINLNKVKLALRLVIDSFNPSRNVLREGCF